MIEEDDDGGGATRCSMAATVTTGNDDTTEAVQYLRQAFPLPDDLFWTFEDPAFQAWTTANLSRPPLPPQPLDPYCEPAPLKLRAPTPPPPAGSTPKAAGTKTTAPRGTSATKTNSSKTNSSKTNSSKASSSKGSSSKTNSAKANSKAASKANSKASSPRNGRPSAPTPDSTSKSKQRKQKRLSKSTAQRRNSLCAGSADDMGNIFNTPSPSPSDDPHLAAAGTDNVASSRSSNAKPPPRYMYGPNGALVRRGRGRPRKDGLPPGSGPSLVKPSSDHDSSCSSSTTQGKPASSAGSTFTAHATAAIKSQTDTRLDSRFNSPPASFTPSLRSRTSSPTTKGEDVDELLAPANADHKGQMNERSPDAGMQDDLHGPKADETMPTRAQPRPTSRSELEIRFLASLHRACVTAEHLANLRNHVEIFNSAIQAEIETEDAANRAVEAILAKYNVAADVVAAIREKYRQSVVPSLHNPSKSASSSTASSRHKYSDGSSSSRGSIAGSSHGKTAESALPGSPSAPMQPSSPQSTASTTTDRRSTRRRTSLKKENDQVSPQPAQRRGSGLSSTLGTETLPTRTSTPAAAMANDDLDGLPVDGVICQHAYVLHPPLDWKPPAWLTSPDTTRTGLPTPNWGVYTTLDDQQQPNVSDFNSRRRQDDWRDERYERRHQSFEVKERKARAHELEAIERVMAQRRAQSECKRAKRCSEGVQRSTSRASVTSTSLHDTSDVELDENNDDSDGHELASNAAETEDQFSEADPMDDDHQAGLDLDHHSEHESEPELPTAAGWDARYGALLHVPEDEIHRPDAKLLLADRVPLTAFGRSVPDFQQQPFELPISVHVPLSPASKV